MRQIFKPKNTLLRRADMEPKQPVWQRFRKGVTKKRLMVGLAGLVVVFLLAVAVNFVRLRVKNAAYKRNPRAAQQAEEKGYVAKLRQLTYPPEKENPTIAIITDADKARQQNSVFYKQAKNGDVVVKYKSIAYILDAKNNKIVNIAPVYDEQ